MRPSIFEKIILEFFYHHPDQSFSLKEIRMNLELAQGEELAAIQDLMGLRIIRHKGDDTERYMITEFGKRVYEYNTLT